MNCNDRNYALEIKRPVLITISGSPGSGKSTAAKEACRILNGERIYVGQIRREMARKMGMSIEQFNDYALDNPESDVDVDKQVASNAWSLYLGGKNVIVEGRTQFHFLPKSLKFYISVETAEGARRILEDLNGHNSAERNEAHVDTLEEMIKKINDREENDVRRYMKFYGFDHREKSHYDCIIDSTHLPRGGVVDNLLKFVYERQRALISLE